MATYRTTAKKYCADLESLCGKNTFYSNKYPYNLLYYYGNDKFSADCNNLVKSLVNGRNIQTAGVNTYQSDLSLTDDVTELGLLNKCRNVTSDFSHMGNIPHLLYMSGHVGTYLGYEVTVNGKIYNTVEATAWSGDFGHDGIIFSYTDTQGNRCYHKGGSVKSKWAKNGDLGTLIDTSILSDKAISDPVGNRPLTYQENWMCEMFINDKSHYLKMGANNNYNDVVFVQSYLQWYGYYKGTVDGDFGNYTKQAVINWQKINSLVADGEIGPRSWAVIRLGNG